MRESSQKQDQVNLSQLILPEDFGTAGLPLDHVLVRYQQEVDRAKTCIDRKDAPAAINFLKKAIELGENIQSRGLLGFNDKFASTQLHLGKLAIDIGYLDLAKTTFGKINHSFDQGLVCEDTAKESYRLLGFCYKATGELEPAKNALNKASKLYEKQLIIQTVAVCAIQGALMQINRALGDLQVANSNLDKLFKVADKSLAIHRIACSQILLELGYSELKQESYQFAERILKKNLDYCKELTIPQQGPVLACKTTALLGRLYQLQAKYALSTETYEQSLELYEQAVFADMNRDLIDVRLRLAQSYSADGHSEKAVVTIKKTITNYYKLKDRDAINEFGLILTACSIYCKANLVELAEQFFDQSFDSAIEILQEQDQKTALNNLSILAKTLQDYNLLERSEKVCNFGLKVCHKLNLSDNKSKDELVECLASIKQAQGDTAAYIDLKMRSLEGQRSKLSNKTLDKYIRSVKTLVEDLSNVGEIDQAKTELDKAMRSVAHYRNNTSLVELQFLNCQLLYQRHQYIELAQQLKRLGGSEILADPINRAKSYLFHGRLSKVIMPEESLSLFETAYTTVHQEEYQDEHWGNLVHDIHYAYCMSLIENQDYKTALQITKDQLESLGGLTFEQYEDNFESLAMLYIGLEDDQRTENIVAAYSDLLIRHGKDPNQLPIFSIIDAEFAIRMQNFSDAAYNLQYAFNSLDIDTEFPSAIELKILRRLNQLIKEEQKLSDSVKARIAVVRKYLLKHNGKRVTQALLDEPGWFTKLKHLFG